MNLLVNACHAIQSKYEKTSASERLSDESAYFGKIIITSRIDNNNCVISIADNADGVDKEDLAKIFEPFYTTKEEGSGTGLGLALSYEIIQRHYGTLEVDSEVGVGTTFVITLPLSIAPNEEDL